MTDDIKALVSELETEARRHFGKTKPLEDHLEWRAADALTRMAAERDEAIAALRAILANHETVGLGASIFQCTTAEVQAARAALEGKP